jgi:hypothetical protein
LFFVLIGFAFFEGEAGIVINLFFVSLKKQSYGTALRLTGRGISGQPFFPGLRLTSLR